MEFAKYIDHTILKPDAKKQEVLDCCKEAKEYGFAAVVVNSFYAELVSEQLKGTDIKTACVVGFPLGACSTSTKVFETSEAIKNGAQEIDMVINVGALKDEDDELVYQDIKALVDEAKGKAIVKVIIETCLLSDKEKIKACEISIKAGADFVKTSTGFSTGGAKLEDITLMKNTVGDKALVKASGGIRDYQAAVAFINAGADRIGTSSGVKMVNQSI